MIMNFRYGQRIKLTEISLVLMILFVSIIGKMMVVYGDEDVYAYSGEETENTLELMSSVPITINASSVSRYIPSSTKLLTNGVVSNGQPTYEVNIQYKFTAVASFSGAATFEVVSGSVVSDGTASSETVSAVTGTACGLAPSHSSSEGRYVYTYTMTYHVRNVKSFQVKCTTQGTYSTSLTSTLNITLPTTYKDSFLLTYYIIAAESDYSGSRNTTAAGISGKKYKSAFLSAVKVQGSGYTQDGEYIQYNVSNQTYYITTAPKTASGTVPKVGQTIAVDNTIIPRKGSSQLAKVYIVSVGYRQAEDAGSAITGNHIDVFYGTGMPATEPSWNMQNKVVQYFGNNLY